MVPGLQSVAHAADTGTITGIVAVETSGGPKPVANADVRLTFGSKSEARKTGADGKYQFPGLLPGKYIIKVTPPDGLKPKGDGSITVSLEAGDTERADFGLLAPPTPTPTLELTSVPKATATPAATASAPTAVVPAGQPTASPKPATGQSAAASAAEAAAAAAAAQMAPSPVLVNPLASPVGTPHQGVTQGRTAPTSSVPPLSGQPAIIGAPVASPAPFLFATPDMLIAAASPTPDASPVGTRTPGNGDDVLASGPPRRLITSFEALRQTAGGGTTAQLKSWATESSLVLGVPFRTQIDGTAFSLVNCGPASLTMVLVAFGLDVDPPSVRDYLNHLVGNYDTEAGTSLYVLARIAQEAGLSTFGSAAGLQGWTVDAVREQVRAGHPVITLTKYRFLPGHFGSVTDFDHYIVITGLAGEDFVYNDAAYSTEYGYNLLITPSQLERAWAASSVPRHAVAIGYGDSLKPLPIVPHRLTAESLAVTAPADDVNAVAPPEPVRINRGPAAEWLREQMLDRLGARTAVVNGDLTDVSSRPAPQTRIDPADLEAAVQERPTGSAVSDVPIQAADAASAGDAQASTGAAAGNGTDSARAGQSVSGMPARERAAGALPVDDSTGLMSSFSTLGVALMGFGLILAMLGQFAGLRRPTVRAEALAWLQRLPRVLRRRR
ncbi:MAG: C39 family peptidase [Chloroflexota bacterium]